MARRARKQARQEVASAAEDVVTYIFLTRYTATWRVLPDTDKQALRDSVTQKVASEGGRCNLFLTHGSDYDSVSIVEGVTAAGALRVAEQIQLGGHRTTTMLPGLRDKRRYRP
jgi:uncharacterized protein with GYD domain